MRQAFNMCSSSDDFTTAQREQVVFYTAVRAVVAKMTKGDAPDVDEMNKRVRQLMQEALQSSGVEEVVKIVEDAHGDLDLFDPKHLERIDKIELPNIRLKLLERLLRQQISELGKVNKVKAVEFAERLKNLLKEYNDRSDDAVFAQQVMTAVTDGIKDLMDQINKERSSNEALGIDYEEKAFFDILKSVSEDMKFNYPDEKMIDIAKEIKAMLTKNAQYTDAFRRADILAQMQFDIIMICSKYKYPPVTEAKETEKVYKKVIEQAENFKKYNH